MFACVRSEVRSEPVFELNEQLMQQMIPCGTI